MLKLLNSGFGFWSQLFTSSDTLFYILLVKNVMLKIVSSYQIECVCENSISIKLFTWNDKSKFSDSLSNDSIGTKSSLFVVSMLSILKS